MQRNQIIIIADVFIGTKVIVGMALIVNSFMKKSQNANSKKDVKTISVLIFIIIRTGIVF